jgi:hypothetical protein
MPTVRGLQVYGGTGPIRTITATTHTLRRDEEGAWLRFTAATPITLTVPPDAVGGFINETIINLEQAGAGLLTIAGNGVNGVTIHTTNTYAAAGQGAVLALMKVGSNEWVFTGDRAAS